MDLIELKFISELSMSYLLKLELDSSTKDSDLKINQMWKMRLSCFGQRLSKMKI